MSEMADQFWNQLADLGLLPRVRRDLNGYHNQRLP
jgi:hypothetical protein